MSRLVEAQGLAVLLSLDTLSARNEAALSPAGAVTPAAPAPVAPVASQTAAAPGVSGATGTPVTPKPAPPLSPKAAHASLPVLTAAAEPPAAQPAPLAVPAPTPVRANVAAAPPPAANARVAVGAVSPDAETAGVVVDDAEPGAARLAGVSVAGAPGPAPAPRPVQLGRIGPYALIDAVDHDGLGRVFKARDNSEGADVRVTLLDLDSQARDRDAIVQQLQKAVLAAALLQHPGLARIVDAGVVGEGVYIVNAWTKGRSLAHALHSGWQPTARVAAHLVCKLAQALAAAHAAGVMHGGLNPANVTLDEDNNPVVLGLGYACTAHASDVPSMDPLVTGAAPYLAPEQLQGGAVDVRTDVHALGVLLYELLAGRRAYPGQTVPEVARALMSHDPTPPHWLRFDVPERLSAIAMQALQRNPAARYAQATEVVAALEAWLQESVQEDDAARQALVAAELSAQAGGGSNKGLRRKGYWATAALLLAASAVAAFTWVDRHESPQVIAPEPVPGTSVEGAAPVASTLPAVAEPTRDSAVAAQAAAENAAERKTAETAAAVAVAAATAAGVSPAVAPGQPSPAATPTALSPVDPVPTSAATSLPVPTTPAPIAQAPQPEPAPNGARTRAAGPVAPVPTAKTAPAIPAATKPAVAREKARAADVRAAAAPVGAAAATGTVQLAVSPWGYVDVGGKPAGASPPLNKLTLPEGSHTITIRNEDFVPYVTTIQVSADKTATVRHRFGQ